MNALARARHRAAKHSPLDSEFGFRNSGRRLTRSFRVVLTGMLIGAMLVGPSSWGGCAAAAEPTCVHAIPFPEGLLESGVVTAPELCADEMFRVSEVVWTTLLERLPPADLSGFVLMTSDAFAQDAEVSLMFSDSSTATLLCLLDEPIDPDDPALAAALTPEQLAILDSNFLGGGTVIGDLRRGAITLPVMVTYSVLTNGSGGAVTYVTVFGFPDTELIESLRLWFEIRHSPEFLPPPICSVDCDGDGTAETVDASGGYCAGLSQAKRDYDQCMAMTRFLSATCAAGLVATAVMFGAICPVVMVISPFPLNLVEGAACFVIAGLIARTTAIVCTEASNRRRRCLVDFRVTESILREEVCDSVLP